MDAPGHWKERFSAEKTDLFESEVKAKNIYNPSEEHRVTVTTPKFAIRQSLQFDYNQVTNERQLFNWLYLILQNICMFCTHFLVVPVIIL